MLKKYFVFLLVSTYKYPRFWTKYLDFGKIGKVLLILLDNLFHFCYY